MVKIVIPDDSPPVYQDHPELTRLRQYGEVFVHGTKAVSEDELIERLRGAEIVINVRAYTVFSERVVAARTHCWRHCGRGGSPAPGWTSFSKSRCRPTAPGRSWRTWC